METDNKEENITVGEDFRRRAKAARLEISKKVTQHLIDRWGDKYKPIIDQAVEQGLDEVELDLGDTLPLGASWTAWFQQLVRAFRKEDLELSPIPVVTNQIDKDTYKIVRGATLCRISWRDYSEAGSNSLFIPPPRPP